MLQMLAVIRGHCRLHCFGQGHNPTTCSETCSETTNPAWFWRGCAASQLKYLHDDLTCPFQQPHSAWALPRSIHTALRGQVAGEPVQPLVVISKPPPWVWTHSLGMSRKENALDLAKFVDKGVRVKLSGGREGTQHIIAWTLSNN